MSTFRLETPFLKNVLKDIGIGKIQLPDFQRDWKWDDYRIRSIIASVSQSFPMGMIMELEMGARDTQFGSRHFDGVNPERNLADPEFLVLDGQQRLTALYQALMVGTAVSKRNARGTEDLRSCYYLDMKMCMNPEIEREEAVRSYEENREKTLQLEMFPGANVDFSLDGNQYAHAMFPVHRIFDSDDWGDAYKAHWRERNNPLMGQLFNQFNTQVIKHFEQYTVPILVLEKETPREEVCRVFERVNNRGITLTVFELLTSIFAVSGFQLREDWNCRKERLAEWSVLQKFDGPSFLQTLALLATNANPNTSIISCTRKSILRLSVEDYKRWADRVEEGLKRAVRFLHLQQIFDDNSLAYPAQLVPLAAILANLEGGANYIGAGKKLTRWYWCGVLGELYGTSADLRFANDLAELPSWIKGRTDDEPATVREAIFQEDRLEDLRNKNSAAYKGVHALLMSEGCLHFQTGESIGLQTAFEESIDIHHVFPIAWCKANGIGKDAYNSIINKTPLARRTNNWIRAKAPSEYLSTLQTDAKTDQDTMDKILASHLICANAAAALRKNDFRGFFNARKEALLKAIEKAMGKPVIRDEGDDSDASS